MKFFLLSRTILGGLLATMPAILAQLGVNAPEFGEFGNSIMNLLDALNEVAGLGLVFWGRWRADSPLTLMPR